MPKSVLVALVLVVGVLFVYFSQDRRSVCDTQKEAFQEVQRGLLFPLVNKGSTRAPQFVRFLETCKLGNSPGACYELFALMRKALRDLTAPTPACLPEFANLAQVRGALQSSLEILTLLAWGAKPPERGLQKFSWLETSDISLFCGLKAMFLNIYGQSEYDQLRAKIQAELPAEEAKYENGVCVNCDSRKSAMETLTIEEVWVRSLFSVRCEQYL